MSRRVAALIAWGRADIARDSGHYEEATAAYARTAQELAALGETALTGKVGVAALDCALLSDNREQFRSDAATVLGFARSQGLDGVAATIEAKARHAALLWHVSVAEVIGDVERPSSDDPWLQAEEAIVEASEGLATGAPIAYGLAKTKLERALTLATNDVQAATAHQQLAEALAGLGHLEAAVDHADQAVALVRCSGVIDALWPMVQAASALRFQTDPSPAHAGEIANELVPVLQDLQAAGAAAPLAWALLERSQYQRTAGDLAAALTSARQAESSARGAEAMALTVARTAQVVLLAGLGHRAELAGEREAAFANYEEALAISAPLAAELEAETFTPGRAFVASGASPIDAWRDRLAHIERAYSRLAWAAVQLSRTREGWDAAERGRALLLRGQLGAAARGDGASLDTLAQALSGQGASLVQLCVAEDETLMLTLRGGAPEPSVRHIALGERDLREMGLDDDVEMTDTALAAFDALPALSAHLREPLVDAAAGNSLLYVVADSLLYSVPFAALGDPAEALVERCAVAFLPSASALLARVGAPRPPAARRCLVLAQEDEPGDGIAFSSLAGEVCALEWQAAELTSPWRDQDLLARAAAFDALHVMCHGRVEAGADAMAASWLEPSPGKKLTARDLLDSDAHMPAELVFLNACMSGRFKPDLHGEVEGFWRAFLACGARAVVTTLGYVRPHHASAIAVSFYRHWLAGATRADALRSAQLELRRTHPEPHRWASHVLVGRGD
ncbi:MAG: hypothetical protein QOH76_2829 [Thermoleophilaceae bacterium]|nr:hypothetical protein [Thermoleophilaceae bacterium]